MISLTCWREGGGSCWRVKPGSLKVPLRVRDAEGSEKILRQHGRVLEQPGPLPEDGGPGRVEFVPGRVRTGEPGHEAASVVPPQGGGRVTRLSPVPSRTSGPNRKVLVSVGFREL